MKILLFRAFCKRKVGEWGGKGKRDENGNDEIVSLNTFWPGPSAHYKEWVAGIAKRKCEVFGASVGGYSTL